MAGPCACWPTIVSALYDDVDLIVGVGTSFGGDESPICRVEVKAESIAYAQSIDTTPRGGIVRRNGPVRVHAKHLTCCRRWVLCWRPLVEFANLRV